MSQAVMKLDIVSLEEVIFQGSIERLIATGEVGELGIYPGHSQLLTSLKPGQVRIKCLDKEEEVYYISGGMLEVQPDIVTIMADTVLRAEDLDESAAIEAQDQAQKALEASKKMSPQGKKEAIAQLAEASAMLVVIKELRKIRKQ
jgi:F-type H+-transporting ATPase subunit epsilon